MRRGGPDPGVRRMPPRAPSAARAARAARAAERAAAGARAASGGKGALIVTVMIWVLVVLMIVPEGFDYARTTAMPTEGSLGSRLLWLSLLVFGLVGTLRRPPQTLALLRQLNPWLLVFGALAALSVVWSIDPAVTIRRLIRVVTIMMDALALGLIAWRPTRFQDVLRPIYALMLIGSIIFCLASPEQAIETSRSYELVGAWHGLATQKNGLGALAGTGLLLWLHAWLAGESRWWVALAGAGVSATCLIMSRSSTSLMAAVFASILLLMLLRSPPGLRRYMPYLIGIFVATLLLYSLAVLNLVPGLGFVLKPITMITGKDLTFSGRTAIWAIINEHIAYSPVLGSGYGAYWVGQLATSPSYEVFQRLYFYPTEAHNGYLDIVNDLGLAGGACLLAYVVKYLRQGLRLFATVRSQGALYLALLFQQMIANLSESRWFNVLNLEFVVMTIATVSMGRLLLQQQMERRARARSMRVPVT